MITVTELSSMIDHSIIDPFHTERDMIEGIETAVKYKTGRFTTQPFRVKTARKWLEGTGVLLQTYVGFPHGNDHTEVKVLQAKRALDEGAQELDMVINISSYLSGDLAYVEQDVRAVVEAARPYGATVKSILECFYLTRPQRVEAALIAERAGVAFVKTSTGQRPDMQASIAEDCRVFRAALKPETIIKASGGCFNLDALLLYHKNGARRFGASETARILEDLGKRIADGTPA